MNRNGRILPQNLETVDHNSKSGNDRKECPFFQELQTSYGYRPNVTPRYTAASSGKVGASDASSSEETTSRSQPVAKESGKRNKTEQDEIVSVLKTIQNDKKQDQDKLLEVLEKQHQDRVKQEDKKLELLSTLISNFKQ